VFSLLRTFMDHMWNNAVAKARDGTQTPPALIPPRKPRTVALVCQRCQPGQNGKEGVNGSSPLEGFANAPLVGCFCSNAVCGCSNLLGMEQVMEQPVTGSLQTPHSRRLSRESRSTSRLLRHRQKRSLRACFVHADPLAFSRQRRTEHGARVDRSRF
jgi:hypothetical protein